MTFHLYYRLPESNGHPYIILRSDTEKVVAHCTSLEITEMICEQSRNAQRGKK